MNTGHRTEQAALPNPSNPQSANLRPAPSFLPQHYSLTSQEQSRPPNKSMNASSGLLIRFARLRIHRHKKSILRQQLFRLVVYTKTYSECIPHLYLMKDPAPKACFNEQVQLCTLQCIHCIGVGWVGQEMLRAASLVKRRSSNLLYHHKYFVEIFS